MKPEFCEKGSVLCCIDATIFIIIGYIVVHTQEYCRHRENLSS